MLFTQSKYSQTYFRIVEHRKANPSTERTESHHIIPRCLGGTNDPDNLVDLTCREHFICHLLLTKMNDHQGLVRSAWMMAHTRDRVKCNSRTYAYLKENLTTSEETRKKMSESGKAVVRDRFGKNNSFYGRKHTQVTKDKISAHNKGVSRLTPEGRERLRQSTIKRNTGRVVSAETREKHRIAATGYAHTQEAREKLSDLAKGKKFWNDGIRNYRYTLDDPRTKGLQRGRMPFTRKG